MQSETIREIKRSFRRFMNGTAAASMRDKGLHYSVNWGISLPNLREMAAAYCHNRELATELWDERSRECRILATMIMPPQETDKATMEQWIDHADNAEMAEQLAFNLLQHTPFALEIANERIATADGFPLLCAIHTLSRLLSSHKVEPSKLPQQTIATVEVLQQSPDRTVAHAAFNCYSRIICE